MIRVESRQSVNGKRVWFRDHCGAVSQGALLNAVGRRYALRSGDRLLIKSASELYETQSDALYAELKDSTERLNALQTHVAGVLRRLAQLASGPERGTDGEEKNGRQQCRCQ